MPYDKDKGIIHTRVINIAKKDDAGRLRQTIIREIYEDPESVKSLYLFPAKDGSSIEVLVAFNNGRGSYSIGNIKNEYHKLITKNPVRVKSWKITGGYPLAVTSHDKKLNAFFGMNLTIEMLNHVRREQPSITKPTEQPIIHPDKTGIFD